MTQEEILALVVKPREERLKGHVWMVVHLILFARLKPQLIEIHLKPDSVEEIALRKLVNNAFPTLVGVWWTPEGDLRIQGETDAYFTLDADTRAGLIDLDLHVPRTRMVDIKAMEERV